MMLEVAALETLSVVTIISGTLFRLAMDTELILEWVP